MKMFDINLIVGNTIEGIYQGAAADYCGFVTAPVYVKINNVGFLWLTSSNPYSPPVLQVNSDISGELIKRPDIVQVYGHRVADIVVSEVLTSVSIVCENGWIVTDEIWEYGNIPTIIFDTEWLKSKDYYSYSYVKCGSLN